MTCGPPFFVLATQNPIELEGTYPLPEAQLDRFLFNVLLDYLSPEQEAEVVERNTAGTPLPNVDPVTTADEILQFQWLVRQVGVSDPGGTIRGVAGARDPADGSRGAGTSSRSTLTTARACARRSSWCWRRRRGRCLAGAITSRRTTCARWPSRFCATGCSRTSTPSLTRPGSMTCCVR